MDAIRGVRTATPVAGEATLSAEQLAEYEALKNAKEQGEADQAMLETGAQQLVISAREYAEFVQLRKKMEAMKAALAASGAQ
jgi:hypothetical protein